MHRIATTSSSSSRRVRNLSAPIEVAAVLSAAGPAAPRLDGHAIRSHIPSAFEWRNFARVRSLHPRRV